MKLSLKNFKCYHDYTFTLPTETFVLINGQNGIGKTTLFKALIHVFYGCQKNPYSYGKTTCQVKLEWKIKDDLWVINRRNRPNVLEVTINDKIYKDDEAQAMINHQLGMDCDQFRAACCVRERDVSFLDMTPSQRLKFIQTLSLQSNDDIKKITDVLHQTQQSFKIHEREWTVRKETCALLKRQLGEKVKKPSIPKTLIEEKLNDNEKLRNDTELKINELRDAYQLASIRQEQHQLHLRYQDQYNVLSEEKINLQTQYQEVKTAFDAYEKVKYDYEQLKCKKSYDKLLNQLHKLQVPEKSFNDEDVTLYQKLITRHHTFMSELRTYENYKTQLSHYTQTLKNILKTLNVNDDIPIILSLKSEKIATFNTAKQKLEVLKKSFHDIEMRGHALRCPVCKTHLTLSSKHELTQDHNRPSDEDVNRLKSKIQKLEKVIESHRPWTDDSLFKTLQTIQKFKDMTIQKPQPLDFNIDDVKKKLHEHETLSNIYQQAMKKYNQQKENLKQQLQVFEGKSLPSWDEVYYKELKVKIHSQKFVEQRYKDVQLNLEKVNTQLSTLELRLRETSDNINFISLDELQCQLDEQYHLLQSISSEHENLIHQLQAWKDYRQYKEHYKHYMNEKKNAQTSYNLMIEQQQRCEGLQGILDACHEAQILATQQVVDHFNECLSHHLSQLFDDDFHMTLEGYKKHPTNNEYKPSMSIVGEFNGRVLKDLSEDLSDGQFQLCTLAIRLAMGDVLGRPFLWMDESMNKLDPATQERLLNYLRVISRNGIQVMIISHHSVPGMFDKVIVPCLTPVKKKK